MVTELNLSGLQTMRKYLEDAAFFHFGGGKKKSKGKNCSSVDLMAHRMSPQLDDILVHIYMYMHYPNRQWV